MAAFPLIRHLGATRGVTGSCHLVQTGGLNILIDCGQAHGRDAVASMHHWPVRPSDVHFVFLTHAHVDHSGRLPELVRAGFRGEILTTHATRALLVPMLEDALSFSDFEGAGDLARKVGDLAWGFEFGEDFVLRQGVRFRFGRAGHILGSCFVRLEHPKEGWSILFSGDLGGRGRPLLPDPDPPPASDLLVLESTYGDRVHSAKQDRLRTLGKILSRSLADGGKVLIPSFALGRTQELLYELDRLDSDPELADEFPSLSSESKIPVFLDSPLGSKLTEIHQKLVPFWDDEAKRRLRSGDNPLDFERLFQAARHQDHRKLLEYQGPCIILAGSGMCTGGRIVDHLKAALEEPRNDLVFVGYQASGTPGRRIAEQAGRPGGYVELDGERFSIRAGVHSIGGYSAHADRDELIAWVKSMHGPGGQTRPGRIRLVHGEPAAKKALAAALGTLGYQVEGPA
ncbi:MAG: MBL fold metallo-hydrolase [Deltaproteobacteria bacterium]|nr:MBL fold metallo-hydrolase [Deltaproteobacteria bacterium]